MPNFFKYSSPLVTASGINALGEWASIPIIVAVPTLAATAQNKSLG